MERWAKSQKYADKAAFACICVALDKRLALEMGNESGLDKAVNGYVTTNANLPRYGQLGCQGFILFDKGLKLKHKETSSFLQVKQLAFEHVESLLDSLVEQRPAPYLCPGEQCRIRGLRNRAELNGEQGICLNDPKDGSFVVFVQRARQQIKVKMENLENLSRETTIGDEYSGQVPSCEGGACKPREKKPCASEESGSSTCSSSDNNKTSAANSNNLSTSNTTSQQQQQAAPGPRKQEQVPSSPQQANAKKEEDEFCCDEIVSENPEPPCIRSGSEQQQKQQPATAATTTSSSAPLNGFPRADPSPAASDAAWKAALRLLSSGSEAAGEVSGGVASLRSSARPKRLGIADMDAEHDECLSALKLLAEQRNGAALAAVLKVCREHFEHEEALWDKVGFGNGTQAFSATKSHIEEHRRVLGEMESHIADIGGGCGKVAGCFAQTLVEEFFSHINDYDSQYEAAVKKAIKVGC
ncbi:unnamed protein product [Amoebophrya sp. A25]|nr:unnamed protein product [Amoebophrya sp. A25]|eukprot:GSA25T00000741001.1